MPGPLAKNRVSRSAAPNSPNQKTRKRLQHRIDGFSKPNDKYAGGYRFPGSENRNK